MRKTAFCIYMPKKTDQLHSKRAVDQRLCFLYIDSTIHLFIKFQASNHQPYLCQTWSKTPKTGFLATQLESDQTLTAP